MKTGSFINRFRVNGVSYFRDFEITFRQNCTILVGDNGVGKTTILNILYGVLSKRWLFLAQCSFDSVEIEFFDSRSIYFLQSEVIAFNFETEFSDSLEDYDLQASSRSKFHSVAKIIDEYISKDQIVYLPTFRKLREELRFFRRTLDRERGDIVDERFSEFVAIGNQILIPDSPDYLNSMNVVGKPLVNDFVTACNQYLVNTMMNLRQRNEDLYLINKKTEEEVPLSQLSSGEKHIVYIFSRIFLTQEKNLVVLFDEPELSLSLPWQRAILPDIFNSGQCGFLLAITHSPFVFDNELDKYADGINLYLKSWS